MFEELLNVKSPEELDSLAVKLLDEESFRRLQEEMVSRDVALSRADYWTADVVGRRTRDTAAVQDAIDSIKKESQEKKFLHVMQIIIATVPGVSASAQRFLKRVTFA